MSSKKYLYLLLIIQFIIIIFLIFKNNVKIKVSEEKFNTEEHFEPFKWTVPKPPVIIKNNDGSFNNVVVYVSSGLFNLYENMYSLGLEQIKDDEQLADYTPDLEIIGLVKTLKEKYNLPDNGMAGECARKGWYSYIPARDGFNMAFLLGSVSKVQFKDVQNIIPEITKIDWSFAGTYVLSAVYGFDMYNLICRCNSFIFNSDGIAMDDGSCVEIGLGTNRGLPIVIYRTQKTSNFSFSTINPMVEGASGTSLNTCYSESIPDAINNLNTLIKETYDNGNLNYCNIVPPPPLPSYWCDVGNYVWNWKYKQYIINPDGTLNKDNYSDQYLQFLNNTNTDLGKSLIVAKIILLVKEVQKKYNVVPKFMCTKS